MSHVDPPVEIDPRIIVKLLKIHDAHKKQQREALEQLAQKSARAVKRAVPEASLTQLQKHELPALALAAEFGRNVGSTMLSKILESLPRGLRDEYAAEVFSFRSISNLPPLMLQEVLRRTPGRSLATALLGAPPDLEKRVTDNLSRRAAAMLGDEIEAVRAQPEGIDRRAVLEARNQVAQTIQDVAKSADWSLEGERKHHS